MSGNRIRTTILFALLLLALLSRQVALLLHHPHHEVSRCELIKTKSSKGTCHFHESVVKCALCELITQPASTFSNRFFELRFIASWPKKDFSFVLREIALHKLSKAPTLRGPPVA